MKTSRTFRGICQVRGFLRKSVEPLLHTANRMKTSRTLREICQVRGFLRKSVEPLLDLANRMKRSRTPHKSLTTGCRN